MFEAFRETDYRRFWVTQFISNIGSWMQVVAQGWLVYRLTDSAFLLGFVAFASSAPAVLLMLPGGVVADHFDRKRVVGDLAIRQLGTNGHQSGNDQNRGGGLPNPPRLRIGGPRARSRRSSCVRRRRWRPSGSSRAESPTTSTTC